jgi:hypothetical protein
MKEKKIIAYCGIDCGACPAYVATQKNDDALRTETAKKWSEMFKADFKAADIHCDGCLGESPRMFHYCKVCEIRRCARAKKIANCAFCPEYSCAKLDKSLAHFPEARALLEALRKTN